MGWRGLLVVAFSLFWNFGSSMHSPWILTGSQRLFQETVIDELLYTHYCSAAAAAASGTPQSPATQDSPLESCKSAEIMTKSDFSSTTGVLTSNSLFPHTSLATKTSPVSTPSFSSAGAGSEAGKMTSQWTMDSAISIIELRVRS